MIYVGCEISSCEFLPPKVVSFGVTKKKVKTKQKRFESLGTILFKCRREKKKLPMHL
jgi:hypothetical protein